MPIARTLAACVFLLACCAAQAHKPSDSYLSLDVRSSSVEGRWDIALRDLDLLFDLDSDRDGRLTWGELRVRLAEIDAHARERLTLTGDGSACMSRITDHMIDSHTDGNYLVLMLSAECPQAVRTLRIRYALLFDADSTHRGLLKLTQGKVVRSAVFAPDAPDLAFDAGDPRAWRTVWSYVIDGIEHIATGYDHLLFLCSLLLPAVVFRRAGRWLPSPLPRPVMLDVLRTVTAFTAAHSITLGLAAFGVLQLPSRVVESAIALSVALAALNNVFAVVNRGRWLVAFGFGLVHGFGFASVLADLTLTGPSRAIALFGFNLGVELGQLAVVAVLLPVIYLLRTTVFYRRAVLTAGSSAIAVVAVFWLLERAFDLQLFAVS